jgi:hypothetical protein
MPTYMDVERVGHAASVVYEVPITVWPRQEPETNAAALVLRSGDVNRLCQRLSRPLEPTETPTSRW